MLRTLRRLLIPFTIRSAYLKYKRRKQNQRSFLYFTSEKASDFSLFPQHIFSHQSLIIKDYPEPWYQLQFSKAKNIDIAARKLNGCILRENRSLSFWEIIGEPSKKNGFSPGMTIQNGKLGSSIGGGLCQLSNALFWMAINLGFVINERHRHSLDIFPDTNRTIPFGTGATVFYNYMDLIFTNPFPMSIIIKMMTENGILKLDAYSDHSLQTVFKVVERDHHFEKRNDQVFRKNKIVRETWDNGSKTKEEILFENDARALYQKD